MLFWPCKNESELALVRDQFYPQHAKSDFYSAPAKDTRQQAVDKVNVWLFKAGSIPHPVTSTSLLTEALLHDAWPQRQNVISEHAMQNIYAMAFCKFVNGFVDRDVAKSIAAALAIDQTTDEVSANAAKGESSMYANATKIGMPEVFIDLRHKITHGQEMPSREVLRAHVTDALQWLWDRWWSKNAKGDPARALWEFEERKQASAKRKERTALEEMDSITKQVELTS